MGSTIPVTPGPIVVHGGPAAACSPKREVMCLHYSYRGWIYPYMLRDLAAMGGWELLGAVSLGIPVTQ